MAQEITTKIQTVSMMKSQQQLVSSISQGLESIIGKSTDYQRLCGYNILNSINTLLSKNGLNHTSPKVDKESVYDAIKFAVVYQLNTDNKEVFVITRNEKRKDSTGKEFYITKIECKPQYKGQLKIISTFGRKVKKVYPEWIVREGDEFTYATFKGIEVIPPTWTPKNSEGKVVRVVVPVMYNDGFVDYRIAERESVATNIKAQIKQSVMFDSNKEKILTMISDMTLDELLTSKELSKYINDTYTGISQEEMIITKLVINATKRVPVDYTSATQRELLEKTFDNSDVYVKNHNAAELLANEQTALEMKDTVEEITVNVDDNGVVEEQPQPATSVKEEKQEEDLELDDLF